MRKSLASIILVHGPRAGIWFKRTTFVVVFGALVLGSCYTAVKFWKYWEKMQRDKRLAAFASTLSKGFPPAAESDLPSEAGHWAIRETINHMVPDVHFADLSGRDGSLRDYRETVLVISMTSVGCPISKKLVPALARLSEGFRGKRVRFLLVNADSDPSRSELERHAARLPDWRYVHDSDNRLARALSARTTTETLVIDEAQTLRYRGAVNDQYDVGVNRTAAAAEYLHDALTAVLDRRAPKARVTPAPGCNLGLAPAAELSSPVTWHNQISRFIQYNCVECHRPGEAAPFSLETYQQVFSKKGMIERVLERGIMPPWFADESYGKWRNGRSISETDRHMFSEWVSGGCVWGEAADAPAPLKRVSGWAINQPDIVIDVDPQQVPAEGVLEWVKLPVAFAVTNDLWVSEAEIRPSEPEVVHHAMLFIEYPEDDPRGFAQTKGESEQSGGGTGFWLSYFPGRKTMVLPPGRGKLIPRNGKIYIQLHYTPNGTALVDRPKIGLKLLPSIPERAVVSGGIVKGDIRIMPNSRPKFVHSEVFDEDVRLLVLMPHMHTRGSAAAVFLKHLDGRHETLLSVTNYDFNWQVAYEFRQPLFVPRGTEIIIQHEFDNTSKNPWNPDPAKQLRYGYRTSDEMMVNFFDWESASDNPTSAHKRGRRPFR